MKLTDDYESKLGLWARNPRVIPLPKASGLPHFGVRRFSSYEELNAWKQEFLLALAEKGGVRWTK